TQQLHMLDPALGEGLPASHLGVPTTLRAQNGHQRRGRCHGCTPSRLCLGGSGAWCCVAGQESTETTVSFPARLVRGMPPSASADFPSLASFLDRVAAF